MAAQMRPGGRRFPSGAWSRLKPSSLDTLESYGLPSKGETRLNDFKTQETYYHRVVDRWLKVCAESGNSTELERQFASLSLLEPDDDTSVGGSGNGGSSGATRAPSKLQKNDVKGQTIPANSTPLNVASTELAAILMAMRKLREATVATSRTDAFAQRAYAFMIRTAILLKKMESYHPALLYLLHHIHPRTPLSPTDLQEFVGYHILDLACRQGDFSAAYAFKKETHYRDRRIERVLNALVHDNWVVFWMVRGKVDGHIRALMSWAEDGLRLHVLKCLARSYFTAEKGYIERSADLGWEELVEKMQVGWELEGERITLRRPKTR